MKKTEGMKKIEKGLEEGRGGGAEKVRNGDVLACARTVSPLW